MSVWSNQEYKLKKKTIVLSHHVLYGCTDEKLRARDELYKILVAELAKLSRLISWGIFSEPNLERNSSLLEWQWMHLEQEVALLSEKYKNTRETKNKLKSTRKTLKI